MLTAQQVRKRTCGAAPANAPPMKWTTALGGSWREGWTQQLPCACRAWANAVAECRVPAGLPGWVTRVAKVYTGRVAVGRHSRSAGLSYGGPRT